MFKIKEINSKTRWELRLALLLIAVSMACAAISGCSPSGGESGTDAGSAANRSAAGKTESGASTAPGGGGSKVTTGPCVNPYYPIEPEITKKFDLDSTIPDGDTEMTLEQSAPEGDTFTEKRMLASGTSVTTPWKCTPEGLRVAEYENLIEIEVGNFTMETVESSGTTIPAEWKVGDEWTTNYKVKININAGPVSESGDGTVSIGNKLVSMGEKIKVKGGEFDAARVDAEIRVSVSVRGVNAPSQTIKLSRWFSPKVGLVKQEVSGAFGKETMVYAGTVPPQK